MSRHRFERIFMTSFKCGQQGQFATFRLLALMCMAIWQAGCAVAPALEQPVPSSPRARIDDAAPGTETPLLPEADMSAQTDPLLTDNLAAEGDLWDRLRRGFAMPNFSSELVRNREQWYAARPDYMQRMSERGGRYLFYIVEELERRRMPTELALLPFIESAFNPQAMSSAQASGMWQFIPSTGKHFALKQNIFRDDRRDVLASTRAALDYLQKLHGMFGDWHLALAAYNWGEGSVQRAMARNQKAGLPTDYASLNMPNETQYYVPKFQAIKNIVSQPAAFGLQLPVLANHPYFLSVPIDRDIDMAVAARLAGLSLEEFQALNPQMNKPVIFAAGTAQILLPYDNAEQFVSQLQLHRGPLSSWTAWTASQTLRPAEVARQVGMDEALLVAVNRIPPRMLVKAGSTLLVVRTARQQTNVSVDLADNASISLAPDAPPLRKFLLRAGRKDNVVTVSRRYGVAPAQLAQWNSVAASAQFKPGQMITLLLAARPRSAAPAARSPSPLRTAKPSVRVARN
jgi:membrane-bound lytic murein transglycosylase D